MLIAITVLCVIAGTWVRRSIRQRSAIEMLEREHNDVTVHYDYELDSEYRWVGGEPPGGAWLCNQLGVDYLAAVTSVAIDNPKDSQLATLGQLDGLQALDLNGQTIGDAGLMHVSSLTGLRRLHIASAQISDKGLAALESLTNLQDLQLLWCWNITDAGMGHLAAIRNLRRLSISEVSELSNAGVGKFAALRNLRELDLTFNEHLTDAVLEPLQSLPQLRRLELAYDEHGGTGGLRHLAGFRALESLVIYQAVRDADLDSLQVLPKLKSLSLIYGEQLTDEGLANFEKLPGLEDLYVCNLARVTDAGLQHLSRLSHLTALNIWGDAFELADNGLGHISRVASLRKLRLTGCDRITEAGVLQLAALKNLEELAISVDHLQQLSPTALSRLRAALPRCRVTYEQLQRGF